MISQTLDINQGAFKMDKAPEVINSEGFKTFRRITTATNQSVT